MGGCVGCLGASGVCSILWRWDIKGGRGYCCGVIGLFVWSGEGVRHDVWSDVMGYCILWFGWVIWVRGMRGVRGVRGVGDVKGVGGCCGAGGVHAWGLGVGIMYSVGRGE